MCKPFCLDFGEYSIVDEDLLVIRNQYVDAGKDPNLIFSRVDLIKSNSFVGYFLETLPSTVEKLLKILTQLGSPSDA